MKIDLKLLVSALLSWSLLGLFIAWYYKFPKISGSDEKNESAAGREPAHQHQGVSQNCGGYGKRRQGAEEEGAEEKGA